MHKQLSPGDWFILLVLAFIWGSSFILMKEGLVSFTSSQVAALRLSLAGIALLPYSILKRRELNFGLAWKIFLIGLFGNGIPAFLFTWSEVHISSAVAGILNTLTPIFTLTIGILFFRATAGWKKILGIFIAFAGSVLLILLRDSSISASDANYGWAVVVATMCYGLSVNLLRKLLQNVNPLLIVSFAFLMLGTFSSLYLFTTDFLHRMQTGDLSWHSLGYIFILGVMGTSVANILYYRLVQKISPINASLVTFLMPLVALGWGWLDGEPLGFLHIASMLVILSGVYLVLLN